MKNNAIVTSVYGIRVTQGAPTLEGFSWLYKTWKAWRKKGRGKNTNNWDLICTFDSHNKEWIPLWKTQFPEVIFLEVEPTSNWALYSESRHVAPWQDSKFLEVISNYATIFKTDFNTIALRNLFAIENLQDVMVSNGGWKLYAGKDNIGVVSTKLANVAADLEQPYWGFAGAGDSILANAPAMIRIMKLAAMLTQLVGIKYQDEQLPGWHGNFQHLFALDLAINATCTFANVRQGGFELRPIDSNKIASYDYAIKPWNMHEAGFNIKQYFEDASEYRKRWEDLSGRLTNPIEDTEYLGNYAISVVFSEL